MIKFTPGPWAHDIATQSDFCIEIKKVEDNPENTVEAYRKRWVASVHQQFGGSENGYANARLIAAAPEMYDMLVAFQAGTPPSYDDMVNLLNRINHA